MGLGLPTLEHIDEGLIEQDLCQYESTSQEFFSSQVQCCVHICNPHG